jgi:hypothetical protein
VTKDVQKPMDYIEDLHLVVVVYYQMIVSDNYPRMMNIHYLHVMPCLITTTTKKKEQNECECLKVRV